MSLQWNSAAVEAAITRGAEEGVFEAAQVLQDLAVQKTPIQDGILRASAKATADGLESAVSFNTPYAVRQHEDLALNHPNGGEAKYLERAANSFMPVAEVMIAQAIQRETGL
ncbi:hypothetical protein [Rhodococcoides fascians]|uniref:hypothetical protein n=1 Tax=Rhodococcoides fascians TaxID=1828 RepID=UPI0005697BB8|nr:hypothetical protein [Rhodococcus fascians]